ncbi:protein regulator of cytokinesis 1 isoform X2 [Anolis carolinensis]|uniref:protein regulator of cytokinesis 1 isoform X2 n=1 Tax=Anolis carolinensis TaxID=28377 RepID=UPI002F2B1A56
MQGPERVRRPRAMRKSEILADESVACLSQALRHLHDIWEEIGIPEEQRLERTQVVRKHVKGLLEMMVAEEESLKKRLLQSINVCRKKQAELCKELQLAPFEEDEEATILQLEKDLRTRVEVMIKQKRERLQEMKALQEQDQDLCDLLCTQPFAATQEPEAVPSLAQLDAFRRHLTALTAEKERRWAEFLDTKQQILLRMEELEQSPETTFERDVVCEDEDAFCLSTQNIANLKELLQQLELKRSQKEALCEDLRSRVVVLWNRLQVPAEEREAFSPYMVGFGSKIMNALQQEEDRLEQLKRDNIQNVVEAIRTELVGYWDKCFFSEQQRRSFAPYFQDDFTEELLQQHDAEILRMKQYYETHQELFEGVRKWEDSWRHFQELERKASDPSRFTNRGGNLLKEEKLRVKLQKTLSKLEAELQDRVERWEQEHREPFLVQEQPFLQYVAEQWRLHHLEKERERQERQLKKSREIEEEMKYGSSPRTPNKRRALGFTLPGKVRKLNITASTPNSTMRSNFRGSLFNSPAAATSRLPLSGRKQPIRTPIPSASKTPRNRRLENKENISQLNGTTLSAWTCKGLQI